MTPSQFNSPITRSSGTANNWRYANVRVSRKAWKPWKKTLIPQQNKQFERSATVRRYWHTYRSRDERRTVLWTSENTFGGLLFLFPQKMIYRTLTHTRVSEILLSMSLAPIKSVRSWDRYRFHLREFPSLHMQDWLLAKYKDGWIEKEITIVLDRFAGYQVVPPHAETAKKLMHYFLNRPDWSIANLHKRNKRQAFGQEILFDVVFIVDTSGSLSKKKFRQVSAALKTTDT